MKKILQIINISQKPVFKATTSLMTNIVTVSRLNYKPDLLPVKSICELPRNVRYSRSFEETCIERATSLWQNQQSQINVLWSGGIDSTVALVALLMTRPADKKINVYCNINSINENAAFYVQLLKNKNVSILNSSNVPADTPVSFVTGELGDQIFGSDLLFKIVNSIGIEALSEEYEKIIPRVFVGSCGEQWGIYLFDRYRPIIDEAPFRIVTAFDFIWWWNFTQKWQCVKFRKQYLTGPNINCIHFFETENFQLWSMNNHHLKIGKTVQSYKLPAKQFIYSYDHNESYLEKKRKHGSPYGHKIYFYVLFEDGTKLHTWEECNRLINDLTPEFTY